MSDTFKLFDPNAPKTIAFLTGNDLILTITPDGRLERGPGFATDDAASLAFFDCLALNLPSWIGDLRARAESAEAELSRLRGAQ